MGVGVVLLAVLLVLLLALALYQLWRAAPPRAPPLEGLAPVAELDLARYAGTWYEHYRAGSWFERGLEGVTAEYARNADGTLGVTNCGRKRGAGARCGRGTAWPTPTPGVLQLSFFPFVSAPYVVLAAEEAAGQQAYARAVVGSPDRKALWLLKRSPAAPGPDDDRFLDAAAARNGFPQRAATLERVAQP